MNLEFTFSVSSDIIWRVTCDLTENTPFIRNVFWGNTEVKDISPSILELIEEQAMKELAYISQVCTSQVERAAEVKHEVMGY